MFLPRFFELIFLIWRKAMGNTITLNANRSQQNPYGSFQHNHAIDLPEFNWLSSPQNCGILMLIDTLLKPKGGMKKSSKMSYGIADRLLNNFFNLDVVMTPPLEENPQQFVTTILDQAKQIVHQPARYQRALSSAAENLLKAFDACKKAQKKEDLFSELENYWKDFSVQLLKEKLHLLKAK